MKLFVGSVFVVLLVIQLGCNYVQAAPHMSAEDSDESSSTESDSEPESPVRVTPHDASSHLEHTTHHHDMTHHHMTHHHDSTTVDTTGPRPDESPSRHDAEVLHTRSSEETEHRDSDESDEDDSVVKFPKAEAGHCPMCPKGPPATGKTESLCPARPEEITKIEAECVEEYNQWKEARARKTEQTTIADIPIPPMVELINATTEGITSPSEDLQMTTQDTSTLDMTTLDKTTLDMTTLDKTMWDGTSLDMTTLDLTTLDVATLDMITLDATTDETTTEDEMEMMMTTMSTTALPVTAEPIHRSKRSRKIIKKKSCYPATCILRKLNLLDSMGQPSISRIQSFAVNMTLDGSKSLEQKAVGCVKEINEAMIDATGDIGKKVGCVAQKVITCLNKGLTCPIMKVSQ